MAIDRLDIPHRKAAELIAMGEPITRVAELVGVSRGTICNWMEDPLFDQYYKLVLADFDAARRARMTPIVAAAANLLLESIARARNQVEQNQPDAPTLTAVTKAFTELTGTARLEQGLPTSHSKTETERSEKPSPRDEDLLQKLDRFVRPGAQRAPETLPGDEPMGPEKKH